MMMAGGGEDEREAAVAAVPFRDGVRLWTRVALLSFGGPAGQIAVMHRLVVDERRWIGERRFLHALNFCMLLPGPEAQQLAIYIGWLLHGAPGGLVAGSLFVLPGFLAILALSALYVGLGDTLLVAGLFFGLKPAVLAVVAEALVRIGRRALRGRFHAVLAALAFLALFAFHIPFPVVVVGAGAAGWLWERRRPAPAEPAGSEGGPGPSWRRALRILLVGLLLWWGPVLALAGALGRDHVLVREGVFFGRMAVVTFGGAYAVLSYVAQQAVEVYGWLSPEEMLDGLGLAETTPGPLIQVVQFVGFLGAFRDPGGLDPWAAAIAGSAVTTWVTFVPSYLWIFLGAPYVERLRGNRGLAAALGGITAAVVGVIANLAVWFSIHVLFGAVGELRLPGVRLPAPDWATLDPAAAVLAVAAALALFRFKVGMVPTLLGSALLGVLWTLLGR